MVSTGIHQNHTPDYGAHVVLQHDDDDDGEYDDSKSYYAHMISGTNDKYVAVNDIVESGQIIGLMGDTGYILSGLSKCVTDKNYGTHLHFETKNLKDAEGKKYDSSSFRPLEKHLHQERKHLCVRDHCLRP